MPTRFLQLLDFIGFSLYKNDVPIRGRFQLKEFFQVSQPKKRRLIVRILCSNRQKGFTPVGRKYTFNPKHQSIREFRINHELLAALLVGTSYAIDDSFREILSLSFDEDGVSLDPGVNHPLAPRELTYGQTLDLFFRELGSGLLGLRLRAIAG